MADALDLVDGVREARAEARREREARAVMVALARRNCEEGMGLRTRSMRRYEEHRCGMAPYGWRLRRYAAPSNPYDRDCLPCYVWAFVRTEPPDDWLDVDGEGGAMGTLNGKAAEPRFCPWCGAPLPRAPEVLRGWSGR